MQGDEPVRGVAEAHAAAQGDPVLAGAAGDELLEVLAGTRACAASPRPRAAPARASRRCRRRRTRVRSRGSAWKWRRAKARMPSMKDSSEPVETSSDAQAPATGRSRSARASAEERRDAREVVVGARDGRRARRSPRRWPTSRARARSRPGAGRASPAAPRARPAPGRRRRGAMSGGVVFVALQEAGEAVAEEAARGAGGRAALAVGRVVVGDDHDRVRRRVVARLRHDVVGRARGQEAPAEPLPPAGDVVGDGDRGERPGRERRQAPRRSARRRPPRRRARPAATSRCRGRARPRRARRRPARAAARRSTPRPGARPRRPRRARSSPGGGRRSRARPGSDRRRSAGTPRAANAPGAADRLPAMPGPDPDCLFCKIVAGDLPATIVERDERTVAFMDINPATRGHALVVPREHTPDLHAIDPEDLAAVARTAQRVAARARDALGRRRRQPPELVRARRPGRRSSTSTSTSSRATATTRCGCRGCPGPATPTRSPPPARPLAGDA